MIKKTLLPALILIALFAGCAAVPHYATDDPPDNDPLPEQAAAADEPAVTEPEIDVIIDTRPMIALTFDDGPGPHTDRILDVLERYGARATFFVVGYHVEKWQDTIRRTIRLGSEVANHTWNHPGLTSISNHRIRQELQTTSAIIEQVIGFPPPPFFRPPFGLVDQRVANVSAELGYAVITWTLDTRDWEVRNADSVYNIIMQAAKEGCIVLMHDTHATTAAAMERVIPALIARGYRLVTVSELLHSLYGELKPGRIYGTYAFF